MSTRNTYFQPVLARTGLIGNCPTIATLRCHESGVVGLLIVRVSLTKTQQVTKRNSASRETEVRAALNKLADSLAGDGSGLGRWVTTLPVGQRG